MIRLVMLMVVLAAWSASAHAAPAIPDCGLGTPAADDNAVAAALRNADAQHCESADTVALDTLLSVYEIILDASATPMQVGYLTPPKMPLPQTLPAVVNGRLRKVLLSHPDRFAAICANIQSLVSRYGDPESEREGHLFVVGLLQTALLIDLKNHGHCLPGVLAAFQHIPPADEVIQSARYFCFDRQWKTPSCKRIRR